MKKLFLLHFIGISLLFNAQVSIDGGTGILQGFGTQRVNYGLHLGVEIPRSSDLTFFMRASFFLPVKEKDTSYVNMTAIDLTTTPYTLSVPFTQQSSSMFIQGGTRSYMINDYDNNFSLYGGSVFGIGINTTQAKFSRFDYTNTYEWEGKYELPNGGDTKGSIYYVALGLQGGMKYTIPIKGTIYLDVTGLYSVIDLANNSAGEASMTYSKINFLVNLGYRRDLY